jgi:hypothetical protein
VELFVDSEWKSVAMETKRHCGSEMRVEVTLQAAGRRWSPSPRKDVQPLTDRPDVLDRYRPSDVPDDLLSPKKLNGFEPKVSRGPVRLTGRSDPPEKQRILARIKLVAAGVVGASLYELRITAGLLETRVAEIARESVR